MVPDVALILLVAGFAGTVALDALTLRLAGRLDVLALPNARSFHQRPTPTAGGLAFVVPLLGYLGWLAFHDSAEASALVVGAGLIALVGLWDDLRELSALPRLAVHLVAAAGFVLVAQPGWEPWTFGLLALGLAWHVNLVNFMDGIDGLAAAQVLVFAAGAQIVALGVPGWTGDLLWLLCGCSVGFLVFNWPPARLFMGDVGSGFLGFLTGALALLLWWQQSLPLATSLILFSVFWLDTSYTLIVRMFTSQEFTQAHRSHLYQKLAARRGHSWTTVFYLLYALFWLLPLAWASVRLTAPSAAAWWLLPALLPPLAAARWLAAGLPDRVVDEPDD